jgi:hypothetical protein
MLTVRGRFWTALAFLTWFRGPGRFCHRLCWRFGNRLTMRRGNFLGLGWFGRLIQMGFPKTSGSIGFRLHCRFRRHRFLRGATSFGGWRHFFAGRFRLISCRARSARTAPATTTTAATGTHATAWSASGRGRIQIGMFVRHKFFP